MSSITRSISSWYFFDIGWITGWANARAAASGGVQQNNASPRGWCTRDNPGANYKIARSTMIFDTSAIPSNATVSAVTLNWHRNYEVNEQNSDPNLYVCPVSATGNSGGYYNQTYFGSQVGVIPAYYSYSHGGASPNVNAAVSLNPSCIVKAGNTILGVRIGHDYNGNVDSPGNIDQFNWIESRTDKTNLVIVYTTPPAVTTGESSSITDTTATLAGTVTDYGGGTVSERGICWATSANPTTANAKATTGSDAISVDATSLTKNTLYHYRAYVITENSTQYGSDQTFTTDSDPTVTTGDVTNMIPIRATLGGNITSNGNGVVSTAGVCWATTVNPTTSNSKTATATVLGAYTVDTGPVLLPGTLYHYRAYVTTGVSTQYGTDLTFRTPGGAILFNLL